MTTTAARQTKGTSVSEQNSSRAAWAPPLGRVGTIVDERIDRLQRDALKNRSAAVAALARLRRAVGKPPGSLGDILEYTLAPEFVDPHAGDTATPQEIAAHVSMTLYAVHQQSQPVWMHRRGYGLGRSIRQLRRDTGLGEPGSPPDAVLRRFHALGTADSLEELVHHARGMVQLLRGQQIPLDYGVFADQLVRWQEGGGPAKVRLVWGRDFYRPPTTTTRADGQSEPLSTEQSVPESA